MTHRLWRWKLSWKCRDSVWDLEFGMVIEKATITLHSCWLHLTKYFILTLINLLYIFFQSAKLSFINYEHIVQWLDVNGPIFTGIYFLMFLEKYCQMTTNWISNSIFENTIIYKRCVIYITVINYGCFNRQKRWKSCSILPMFFVFWIRLRQFWNFRQLRTDWMPTRTISKLTVIS